MFQSSFLESVGIRTRVWVSDSSSSALPTTLLADGNQKPVEGKTVCSLHSVLPQWVGLASRNEGGTIIRQESWSSDPQGNRREDVGWEAEVASTDPWGPLAIFSMLLYSLSPLSGTVW